MARSEHSFGLRLTLTAEPLTSTLQGMGITVAVAIADPVLTDDQLSRLGFRSLGLEITSEVVITVPSDERACVVRTGSSTIIVDGGAESSAESVFRIPGDDDDDSEIDGDILVQSLGSVSGVAPDVDVFELTGVAYESSTSSGPSNPSGGDAPAATQKKRWSFGRLFGAQGH